MTRISSVVASLLFASAPVGCSQGDSIDASGAVFNGIAPEETITLGGTEPFWDVIVTPQDDGSYEATISTLGYPDETDKRSVAVSRFAGNNGLSFSGEFEGRSVLIAVTPGDCGDGMSDRSYPFAATVALGEVTLLGCAYTDASPFSGPVSP